MASTSVELFKLAMTMLASDDRVLFIGQSVAFPGTAMYETLSHIPASRRIEFPVAEDLHVGACVGLSLVNFVPVCIVPRCDFLMRAMDQLVLHLDKLEKMSDGQFSPKVIIRTRVGSKWPLNAGPQHTNDFSEAFRLMLTNIDVMRISHKDDIIPTYRQALESRRSSLVIEVL